LTFDPRDTRAITDAMLRITGDEQLRVRLSEAGPRHVAQYTWTATARATLDALGACTAMRRRRTRVSPDSHLHVC
jgi:glycosyltransferase involved in cell wall biosynthesis